MIELCLMLFRPRMVSLLPRTECRQGFYSAEVSARHSSSFSCTKP